MLERIERASASRRGFRSRERDRAERRDPREEGVEGRRRGCRGRVKSAKSLFADSQRRWRGGREREGEREHERDRQREGGGDRRRGGETESIKSFLLELAKWVAM